MCEVVLNTGNITLESGIARGTVNPFNFIFDVRPAGQGSSQLVRVSLAPWVRATAMETRTLTRKL